MVEHYKRRFGDTSFAAIRRAEAELVLGRARRTPENRRILDVYDKRWPYALTPWRVALLAQMDTAEAERELKALARDGTLRSVVMLGAVWYELNTGGGSVYG